MKVRILYAHDDSKFLFTAREDFLPTKEDLKNDYSEMRIKDMSFIYEEASSSNPDVAFMLLNRSPEKWIQELPKNVSHTSISVGDIVEIDNVKHICLPIGWEIVPKE